MVYIYANVFYTCFLQNQSYNPKISILISRINQKAYIPTMLKNAFSEIILQCF